MIGWRTLDRVSGSSTPSSTANCELSCETTLPSTNKSFTTSWATSTSTGRRWLRVIRWRWSTRCWSAGSTCSRTPCTTRHPSKWRWSTQLPPRRAPLPTSSHTTPTSPGTRSGRPDCTPTISCTFSERPSFATRAYGLSPSDFSFPTDFYRRQWCVLCRTSSRAGELSVSKLFCDTSTLSVCVLSLSRSRALSLLFASILCF